MKNNLAVLACSFLLILFLTSCSLIGTSEKDKTARKELERGTNARSSNKTSVIIGKIISQGKLQQPLLVVAYSLDRKNGKQSNRIHHVILDNGGEFMLYLPAGVYRIFSLVDFNDNNLFEKNETSGVYNDAISLDVGEVKSGISMKSENIPGKYPDFPEDINVVYDFDSPEYGWENGQIVKIYDAIFSPKNAEVGLWSSDKFLKVFGANIFMVETYDPSKIPILFVHGIQGSPYDWIPFFVRMDRTRFQPLLFYYPSGMRLELVSHILFEKLQELHRRYQFKKMCLTAHSMGGFVTQTLLTEPEFEKDIDFIKLYITLATPWSGFESADLAISTSPVVLPSWIDVSSRSMFIKKLLKKSLPDSVPYYLFYGKSDSVSGGRALDQRAFNSAKGKFGFDVTHSTILSDKKTWLKYEQILNEHFFSD